MLSKQTNGKYLVPDQNDPVFKRYSNLTGISYEGYIEELERALPKDTLHYRLQSADPEQKLPADTETPAAQPLPTPAPEQKPLNRGPASGIYDEAREMQDEINAYIQSIAPKLTPEELKQREMERISENGSYIMNTYGTPEQAEAYKLLSPAEQADFVRKSAKENPTFKEQFIQLERMRRHNWGAPDKKTDEKGIPKQKRGLASE